MLNLSLNGGTLGETGMREPKPWHGIAAGVLTVSKRLNLRDHADTHPAYHQRNGRVQALPNVRVKNGEPT